MSWRFLPNADAWSWDFSVLDHLISDGNKPKAVKMLGYMLDNLFERMRYLTGGLRRYVGVSVARAFKNVMNGDW